MAPADRLCVLSKPDEPEVGAQGLTGNPALERDEAKQPFPSEPAAGPASWVCDQCHWSEGPCVCSYYLESLHTVIFARVCCK